MTFHRKILKYMYPKPRRKTLFVLLVLIVVATMLYSLGQRTRNKDISIQDGEISILKNKNTDIDNGLNNEILGTKNNDILDEDRKNHQKHHQQEGEMRFLENSPPTHVEKWSFNTQPSRLHAVQNAYNITVEISKSVLVFTGSKKSVTQDKLKVLFKFMKITFDFLVWNKMDNYYASLPRFIDKYGNPRYQTFVFTNENIFDDFDAYNWDLIKRHCAEFNIGIIILCYPTGSSVTVKSKQLKMLPLTFLYGMGTGDHLRGVELPANDVLKLVKTPNRLKGRLPGKKHVFFYTKHPTFKNIMFTKIADGDDADEESLKSRRRRREAINERLGTVHLDGNKTLRSIKALPLALYDQGHIDGVRKFFFGVSFWESWLYQLVLVDALQIVSNGNLGLSDLQRYVQVDVDDIFVGKTGRRLVKEDVEVCPIFFSLFVIS